MPRRCWPIAANQLTSGIWAKVQTLLFYQRGNFAKAYADAQSGAPETYRDQYASVNYVASLADRYKVVTVSMGDDTHEETLADNLHSVRIPKTDAKPATAEALLTRLAPDLMVVRSPYLPVLGHAKAHQVPTLPCFADIFHSRPGLRGLRDRLYFRRLRRALEGPHIACLSNHSLNASRSLVRDLGIAASRVVPWDWSRITPEERSKTGASAPPKAFYAGLISEDKGVGDILEAIALLKTQSHRIELSVAGRCNPSMPLESWQARAEKMGLSDQVSFLGLVPNTEVRARMAAHDMVLVTSRHSYREGLPNTIYEGLASRSPLVLSDHPAFKGRLIPNEGCAQFRASDPASLAQTMHMLSTDPALYTRLSESAPAALEKLYVGLEWATLIDTFVTDPRNESGWVAANGLDRILPA